MLCQVQIIRHPWLLKTVLEDRGCTPRFGLETNLNLGPCWGQLFIVCIYVSLRYQSDPPGLVVLGSDEHARCCLLNSK